MQKNLLYLRQPVLHATKWIFKYEYVLRWTSKNRVRLTIQYLTMHTYVSKIAIRFLVRKRLKNTFFQLRMHTYSTSITHVFKRENHLRATMSTRNVTSYRDVQKILLYLRQPVFHATKLIFKYEYVLRWTSKNMVRLTIQYLTVHTYDELDRN